MLDDGEEGVWTVAGCLFEVSLPRRANGRWRWATPCGEVTLVGEAVRDREHRFRFRAEAVGASAGGAELHFCGDDGVERTVRVRIAPEADLV